ncbi:MAG: hypothetical protein HONBIEJF_01615 [Fimbriimonadaceae bacterium]|nr:hypothetical protein [Fimbriimonadaceae bacterium]
MRRFFLPLFGVLAAGAAFAQVAASRSAQIGPAGWEKKELLDMVIWRPANLDAGDQIAIVQFKTDKLKGSFDEKVKAIRSRWQQSIEGLDNATEKVTMLDGPFDGVSIQERREGRAGRLFATNFVAEAPGGDFRAIAYSNNLDDRQPKYGPVWNQFQNEWRRNNLSYHSANADASGSATARGDRTSTSVKKSVTKSGNGVSVSVTASGSASSSGSASAGGSVSGSASGSVSGGGSSSAKADQAAAKTSGSSSGSSSNSGETGIQEGIYVARAMRENFNVATGGSEVEPVRDYLWISAEMKVYNGLPAGPDPHALNWQQMAKTSPKLCGTLTVSKAATQITWIGEREPWVLTLGAAGSQTFLANGLQYHRIRTMDGERLGGKFLYEPYQMTIGTGGRIDLVTIEFGADGRFVMTGSIDGPPPAVRPRPVAGRYSVKRNTLWLNFQDGTSKGFSIFRDPGGPSNELIISDKVFKQQD